MPPTTLLASPDPLIGFDNATPEDDGRFAERLRFLIQQAGSIAALAKRLDISPSGIQRYLAGGQPTRRVLIAMASALDLSLLWLMTGEGSPARADIPSDPHQGIRSLTRVPVYSPRNETADAGATSEAKNLAGIGFCRFWLGQHGMEASQIKGIYMRGDSMAPTIASGDTILVNIFQREIVDGDIYAFRQGDPLLIKRAQLQPGGKVRLMSDNPRYSDTIYALDDIECIGRVVWRGSLL